MRGQVSHDVLRRMVSPPPPAPDDVPITSSRAMRLAVTRAADTSHKMVMNVIGLREETLSLDDMLAGLTPDLMLLAMLGTEHMAGLAAVDLNLRAALIEVQTIGRVLRESPDDRAPTVTDATMAEPLLTAILAALDVTTQGTALEGWGQGIAVAGQVPSTRSAGLILPDRMYRVIRMSLDLNVGGRQGELVFALPDAKATEKPVVQVKDVGDWATRFQATVNASPLRLDAQLHRFKMPLYAVENLKVGQVLPLQGCKVTSLKLLARDGRAIATARLGQSGGMRAMRVEAAALPEMKELAQLGQAARATEEASIPAAGFADDTGGAIDMDTDASFGRMPDMAEADGTTLDQMETALDINAMQGDLDASDGDAAPMAALSWDDEETDTDLIESPAPMSTMPALDWSEEGFENPEA